MDDITILTSTIRYNARTYTYSCYDSALRWYSFAAERVSEYASRFGITREEAVEELARFAHIERGFNSAKL